MSKIVCPHQYISLTLLMLLAYCCAHGAISLLMEEQILLYREQYFKTINLSALLFPVEDVSPQCNLRGLQLR